VAKSYEEMLERADSVAEAKQIRQQKRGLWKDYGLSITLAFLFFASWLGQGITQWISFSNEQAAHGEPSRIADFFADFWRATLENWQSEFLQLLSFVVLTGFLIHRGSSESKDGDAEIQASLDRIERRLERLDGTGQRKPVGSVQ
jgi:hypothetical protein